MTTSSLASGHKLYLLSGSWEEAFARIAPVDMASTAIIFVHGFGGNPDTTWTDFHSLMDGNVDRPEAWGHSDVYFYSYKSKDNSIDDCADDLIDFVNTVFPSADLSQIGIFSEEFKFERQRQYERLILIGHSQGGPVIRHAIANAGIRTEHNIEKAPILRARVALFAPALFGYAPTNWLGAVVSITGIRQLHEIYVAHSPSATEMRDKEFLRQIRAVTWECYSKHPEISAYSAHVLFGRGEQVVVRQYYIQDCRHKTIYKIVATNLNRIKTTLPFVNQTSCIYGH